MYKMAVNLIVVVCLILKVTTAAKDGTNNKDVIDLPKDRENRQPTTCPVNELYYPGDQKDNGICDCRPAYIYHTASDKCWPAYQRGPCPTGQYLVVPSDSPIPVCASNPCVVDGYVQWNGKCERLGTINPCSYMFPESVSAALGVNATTLVVSCVRLNHEGAEAPNPPVAQCPNGGRRSVGQNCVPITF